MLSKKHKAPLVLTAVAAPLLLLAFFGLQLAAPTNLEGAALAVTSADLSIAKVVNADLVAAGEQLTYTLTVSNSGTLSATNVVVSDSLPSGVMTAAWSTSVEDGMCDDTADPVVCLLGDIDVGISALITLVVDVDPAITGVIINDAEVGSDGVDADDSNNVASASTTVVASADLSLVKTAFSGTVVAGEPVTYTIDIYNAGPSVATGVAVSDTLPKATTYDPDSNSPACSRFARLVTCLLANPLEPGTSTSFTLVFGVNSEVSGPLTNTAEVSSDVPDDSTGNNRDSAQVTVNAEADLSLLKTASSGSVTVGERLTYTLTVDNAGPSNASNVTITDTLPAGTSFVSATGDICSQNPEGWYDCSLPDLLIPGASTFITVAVDVDLSASGLLINTAEVSSDADDNATGNNRDSALVIIDGEANLGLVKSTAFGNVIAGERLVYTLTVDNAGPAAATGVTITDTLPLGTSFVSATGDICSQALEGWYECSLPDPLTAGASTFITIAVDVDSAATGTLTNIAVISSDADDNLTGNNRASAQVTVDAEADLSLSKTASMGNVNPGQRLTYTLTVNNAGPSDARNVIISDTLPAGTSFVSATGDICSEVEVGRLKCSLTSPLVANTNTVVTLVVDVDSAATGTLTNSAEVSSDADDNATGNNRASASTAVQSGDERFHVLLPYIQNGLATGEPNDTCQQAYRISPNVSYQFMPNDRLDWYEFDLTITGIMTVYLSDFTPIYGQVAAYKADTCADRRQGFLGNEGDPGLTRTLYVGLQGPGHYFIAVASDGALSNTQPYRLRISVEPSAP